MRKAMYMYTESAQETRIFICTFDQVTPVCMQVEHRHHACAYYSLVAFCGMPLVPTGQDCVLAWESADGAVSLDVEDSRDFAVSRAAQHAHAASCGPEIGS